MPENQPLVSIITPTYNAAAYIAQCLESVQAQTYTHWEHLVIDDGSTDETAEIVARYAAEEPRIRLIRQENLGIGRLGEVYNRALAQARGELVAILEGDDWWHPEKLSEQVPHFEEPDVVFSFCRCFLTDPEGRPVALGPAKWPEEAALYNVPAGRAAHAMMGTDWLTFTVAVTVVMRRSALEAIGGFQSRPYMTYVDYATFMRMALEGRWAHSARPLAYWRRHERSETTNNFANILNGAYRWSAEFAEAHHAKLPIWDTEWGRLDLNWRRFQSVRCVAQALRYWDSGRKREAVKWMHRATQMEAGRAYDAALRLGYAMMQLGSSPMPLFRLLSRLRWRLPFTDDLSVLISEDLSPEEVVPLDLRRFATGYRPQWF